MKQVKTCMNCKHGEWEVWLPHIKVWCYITGKRCGGISFDTVCEKHECSKKTTWKDKWPYSVQMIGEPYEDI